MGPSPSTQHVTRWWPAVRPVDVVGLALLGGFALWVWWASRVQEGDGAPLLLLILALGVVAALARWVAHLHGTGGPILALVGALLYLSLTGGGSPAGFDPEAAAEASGSLLSIAAGLAALVAVRADLVWVRLGAGLVTLGLAVSTWRTGSFVATAIVVGVVVTTGLLLVLPLRERRWFVVWPAFLALLLLLGTATYTALPVPLDAGAGAIEGTQLERWNLALDAVSEEPLYGVGRGTIGDDLGDDGFGGGWARHEPLQVAAETGLVGGVLLVAVLWWTLAWVARPGGGPGSVVAGLVVAGSVAHACFVPIWHAPAVPLCLAALAGVASTPGGAAAWRLRQLWADRVTQHDAADEAADDDPGRHPSRQR